ncbi:MAG: carbamoyl-phosphate synthase (glutamine-hydrolyzing) large subunit [Proteobacteria bacterium]|nr:carbamoyl-phosphate synthase (glutamine-hydrolyzing) large subunit [Pseudomonadota bacterium]
MSNQEKPPMNSGARLQERGIHKVILLGSGGLSIGQAGEFDYSGTQALHALVEEGLEVIVVNPNIATVQTNPGPKIKVYLYPVTGSWVEKIIASDRPQGIVAGFGGQTALSCLLDLDERGVLAKYGVENLGTSTSTLRLTEDRNLFAEKMTEIGIPVPENVACHNLHEALEAAKKIGFPVICRMAYALGGLGSGFAHNAEELTRLVQEGLAHCPQVLVEKSLRGWKEVEYEVMRDTDGSGICICNMENFDPLGIHTGDSIVVCPSQSLSDQEYQSLRSASLKVVEALEIVGECNAQFALSPDSLDFYIIEVNARLSRSSALASKASGYPIAFIAAKVVLGYGLQELTNPVTGVTKAFFEPALDYLTLKIPRWDLTKFKGAHRELGSTMKSVGEIMAIGRNFQETVQKAVRSVTEIGPGLSWFDEQLSESELLDSLAAPTDTRIYKVCGALRHGIAETLIHEKSKIDPWFIAQLAQIIACERQIINTFTALLTTIPHEIHSYKRVALCAEKITKKQWLSWKICGFSDEQIVFLAFKGTGLTTEEIKLIGLKKIQELSLEYRKWRKHQSVVPVVKKIDTTAAEYPSPSNYLYMSYAGSHHDDLPPYHRPSAIILGGGSYRIGTSVEFDWCAVSCSDRLQKNGWHSIIVNCNPETVSTDYNVSDRLYFEEIILERILDIHDFESPRGVITSMGGQLPNSLAGPLAGAGIKLLGHSDKTVDMAENRSEFSAILDELSIDQPRWTSAQSLDDIESFIEEVGFPILVRPSYVLSGSAMKIAPTRELLDLYLSEAEAISRDYPVVVSEFLTGAREIEVDGIAHLGEIVISIVSEHIENAGVHSGDATTVVPAQKLYVETVRQVKRAVRMIAKKLSLHGPFNIQFLAQDNHIKVIECNARAARSFPFISKVIGCHLSEIATDVMIGRLGQVSHVSEDELPHVGVKAALFSFTRLRGADPVLGVEMAATGEVGCLAANFDEALLLALEASRISPPKKGLLISAGQEKNKLKFLSSAKLLTEMNIPLYATEGTAHYLRKRGFDVCTLRWPDEAKSYDDKGDHKQIDVITAIQNNLVDFVVNLPKNLETKELTNGARIRRTAVAYNCSLITDMEKAVSYIRALYYSAQFISTHTPTPLPQWHSSS